MKISRSIYVLALAAALIIGLCMMGPGAASAQPNQFQTAPSVGPAQAPSFPIISAKDLKAEMDSGKSKVFIVDARTFQEFREGHLPGSINISPDKFNIIGGFLPKDKNIPLVFYCRGVNCSLSHSAAASAFKFGYRNIRIFSGGMPEWLANRFPVDKVK